VWGSVEDMAALDGATQAAVNQGLWGWRACFACY